MRVYAAWLAEADQHAATGIAGRMPSRPVPTQSPAERARTEPRTSRERLAVELLGVITSGAVADGAHLPGIKTLAAEPGVSVSTVHRAFELLREWNVVEGAPGERPRVRTAAARPVDSVGAAEPAMPGRSALSVRHWAATLRGRLDRPTRTP